VSTSGGTTSGGAVTFDPSRGARPRPGTYPVEVLVEAGDQRASTTVRFVVERHPCLQIRPQPSFTWDPFTSTANLKVAVWCCGNVDLDVNWAAQLKGRRLEVEPATVKVFADGGVMDTTLTINIPDGNVDLHTDIDIEALSDAGVDPFRASMEPDHGGASLLRRGSGRLFGAAVIGAIVLGAVAALVILSDGESTVSTGSGTNETTSVAPSSGTPPETTEGPAPSATGPSPTDGTSATPTDGTSATPTDGTSATPAELVVENDARQISIFGGEVGQATFSVVNAGGSDADIGVRPPEITVGPPEAQSLFEVTEGGCEGRLEPAGQCDVDVSFKPPASPPGTYVAVIVLEERTTGRLLELEVTGIAMQNVE